MIVRGQSIGNGRDEDHFCMYGGERGDEGERLRRIKW